MSAGNRYIDMRVAYLRKWLRTQHRPVAVSLCAPAPTPVCTTTQQPKALTLRHLLAVAATLSLCGCPDVAPMPTPSPSATMPPRYVAPARDTATTQQMLHYYFVK